MSERKKHEKKQRRRHRTNSHSSSRSRSHKYSRSRSNSRSRSDSRSNSNSSNSASSASSKHSSSITTTTTTTKHNNNNQSIDRNNNNTQYIDRKRTAPKINTSIDKKRIDRSKKNFSGSMVKSGQLYMAPWSNYYSTYPSPMPPPTHRELNYPKGKFSHPNFYHPIWSDPTYYSHPHFSHPHILTNSPSSQGFIVQNMQGNTNSSLLQSLSGLNTTEEHDMMMIKEEATIKFPKGVLSLLSLPEEILINSHSDKILILNLFKDVLTEVKDSKLYPGKVSTRIEKILPKIEKEMGRVDTNISSKNDTNDLGNFSSTAGAPKIVDPKNNMEKENFQEVLAKVRLLSKSVSQKIKINQNPSPNNISPKTTNPFRDFIKKFFPKKIIFSICQKFFF